MPKPTQPTVSSIFKKKKIKTMECHLIQIVMWAILGKFYDTLGKSVIDEKLKQNTSGLYLENLLGSEIDKHINSLVESFEGEFDFTKDKFSLNDVLAAVKSDSSLFGIEPAALNKFKNKGYANYAEKIISFEDINFLARPQLEALCIYGFGKSYDELVADLPRVYSSKEHIELIKVKVPKSYETFLCHLLSSLEKFNHGNSPVLMNRVMEMLVRETRKTTEALNQSKFYRDAEAYLEELSLLIKECNAGFGVNVTNFIGIWDEPIGIQILETNKIQNNGGKKNIDGSVEIKKLVYHRIFLMTANDKASAFANDSSIIEAELKTIHKQLSYDVKVFCIFQNDWRVMENHNQFDFAVLKIEECPMLMGTIFDDVTLDAKLKKGVFFTDVQKAKEHFDITLGKLLDTSGISVYEPELVGESVDFKNPLKEGEVSVLKKTLEEIIKTKN